MQCTKASNVAAEGNAASRGILAVAEMIETHMMLHIGLSSINLWQRAVCSKFKHF